MDTILDAAKYLNTAIKILPRNAQLPELIENAPETEFSDFVNLWNNFNSFIGPIVEQYAKMGDSMQYTVLHNFYVFFQMYGNRFQTTLDAVNREFALSGNVIEYEEFKVEALKILRLVAETNKTYVLGGIALQNLLRAYEKNGGDIETFLNQPIDHKIFVGSKDGLRTAAKFRRERRADEAPSYEVLGASTAMANFKGRSLMRPVLPFVLSDAKPLMGLPDFLDGAELNSARGGIDIPVEDDWGVNLDGNLGDLYIEISLYFEIDWDIALEGYIEDIGNAVSDFFGCGY